jgi:alpha-glucosidase
VWFPRGRRVIVAPHFCHLNGCQATTLPLIPLSQCPNPAQYSDDGTTFDFRQGDYLRLHITCSVAPNGALTVQIPARKGHYRPWWTHFRIEAIGFKPIQSRARFGGHTTALERTRRGYAVTLPDTGQAQSIVLE